MRWAAYGCLFLLVGGPALRAVVRCSLDIAAPGGAGGDQSSFPPLVAPSWSRALERELALWSMLAGIALVAVDLGRLWHQAYAFYGGFEPVTLELVGTIANQTVWGSGWKAQMISAVLAAAMLAAAYRSLPFAWPLAAVAVTLAAVSRPLTGHAVEQGSWLSLPMILQAVHVIGASLWIGTLFMLAAIGVRRCEGLPASSRDRSLAAIVSGFSPLALGASTALFVAGCATSFIYVGSLEATLSTTYGRVLIAKASAFLVVAAFGYINWQKVRPRLDAALEGGEAVRESGLLLRTAGAELGVAAVVLLLTAILVALPMPMG